MEIKEEKLQKAVDEYVDKNLSLVDRWNTLGEDQISHIKHIAKSIVFAREGIWNGGHFVTSILKNDLENTICYADETCIRALKLFLLVKKYVHVNG